MLPNLVTNTKWLRKFYEDVLFQKPITNSENNFYKAHICELKYYYSYQKFCDAMEDQQRDIRDLEQLMESDPDYKKYKDFLDRLVKLGVERKFALEKLVEWRNKKNTFLNKLIDDPKALEEYTHELNCELKAFQELCKGVSEKDNNVAKELDRYERYQKNEMTEDEVDEYEDEKRVKGDAMTVLTDHARYAAAYKKRFDCLLVARNILGFNILTPEAAEYYGLIKNN